MKVMYPGTFDPITRGHEDVIHRIANMFTEVIVAVADSPSKKTLFSLEDRVQMIEHTLGDDLAHVKVMPYKILTVNFARQNQIKAIVRGLRALSDFDFEFQLAGCNRMLAADIETIFLSTSAQEACVSSSLVREIALLGGDISCFVHPSVAKKIQEKMTS